MSNTMLERHLNWMQLMIGHAKKSGATEEEINILVKAVGILKKYSPIKMKVD